MSETARTEGTGVAAAPPSSQYNPFDRKNESRPDQRYWCDRGLWGAYQASLFLVLQEERNRCRKIIQTFAEGVPAEVRGELFKLIKNI